MTPLVSVCICTYRRPELLARLLDALAVQQGLAGPYEVIVVDNDRERSAAAVLDAARARHPALGLAAACEPRQSIARARNRAVGLARGEWVAFIDDDEEPTTTWLATMYGTARACRADGVVAPVIPRLPPGVAAWVIRGRFLERPRHATGTRVPDDELRTGNLLVRRAVLIGAARSAASEDAARPDDQEGPFDPAYGLSGGEDSDLFGRLAQRGVRFVWCDEAPVHEAVPAQRATLRYLLSLAFAAGQVHAHQRVRAQGTRALPQLLGRGGAAACIGGVLALVTMPLGFDRAVHWARIAAAGAGKLAGSTGSRSERYGRR
jgi:succinoglycan biosynthesis protein ExoM